MSELARMLREAASRQSIGHESGTGSLAAIFSEEVVPLDVFIRDRKFLFNEFELSPIQFEAVRYIERVYYDGWEYVENEVDPEGPPVRVYNEETDLYSKMGRDMNDYWKPPLRMVNFVTLEWGKGSLSPNVRIYDATTGRWTKLRDFVDGGEVASAYAQDGKVITSSATPSFREGFGRMYRVKTRKGYEIDVWEGHRFLTWAKRTYPSGKRVQSWTEARKYDASWERLWDMKVGDPIAVSNFVPEPTQVVSQLDRDVELVGSLLGDGCLTSKGGHGSLVCGTSAVLTRQRYHELYGMFENTEVYEYLDTSNGSTRWKLFPKNIARRGLYGQIRGHSTAVRQMVDKFGMSGHKALTKRVPQEMFSLDDRQTALLLSRLIDTDGWVCKSNTYEIGYGSISKGLAQDVQHLMLRLGASAEIKEKWTTYKDEPYLSYQVRVRDRAGLVALASKLTLLDKEEAKQQLLETLIERGTTKQRAGHGDLSWDRIESIEYIGDDEYWTLTVDGPSSYVAECGVLHHNSGKDHVGRIAALRVAYMLMCMKNPLHYFGKPSQDTIHMLNVAATAKQATDAFFDPMRRAVERDGGWFSGKASVSLNRILFDKNIHAISGHSDVETQEGLNLILGIADEIDAFKSTEQVRKGGAQPVNSVEGILKMMHTSGSTRFGKTFKNLRMSFPRFLGSPIQNLRAKAQSDFSRRGEESRHYVSGPLATWDVNPSTSKFDYLQDYEDDPVEAASKYECKPALAINAYFTNELAVKAAFTDNPQPVEIERYKLVNNKYWMPVYKFADDFIPIRGANYAMHGDLAATSDRAGVAMSHVVRYEEIETQTVDGDEKINTFLEQRPVVKCDFVIAFTSDKATSPPRDIQIRWARQLAIELMQRGFSIQLFTFDKFECLSGDTKIPLLNGTTKTMKELEGSEPFWIYSIKNGRVVPGLCTRAWKTSFREDMVEVELDNGEIVRSTSDHRFMMRDGTYKQAALLQEGDSLMPLYRRQKRISPTSREYEQIYHPEADGSGQRWRFTHSMVSHYMYGKLPKGWVTHHMDCTTINNAPDNLRQMTSADHSDWHVANSGSAFKDAWADPEWAIAHKKRISESRKRPENNKSGREANRYRSEIAFEDVKNAITYFNDSGVIPTRQDMERYLECSQGPLYSRIREEGYKSWKDFKDTVFLPSYGALATRKYRNKKRVNHKIVAVRSVPGEWVYDLQVEDHHNFATDAGVFVHNSLDSMQILEDFHNVESKRISADISVLPYRTLKDLMNEGRISIPKSALALKEILSLNQLPNGRLDHAAGGSKDCSDALACSAMGALELGGQENEEQERAYYGDSQFEAGTTTMPEMPYGFDTNMLGWGSDMGRDDRKW